MSSPLCARPPSAQPYEPPPAPGDPDSPAQIAPMAPPPSRLSYVRPNYACDMLRRLDSLRRDHTLVDAILCVGGPNGQDHAHPADEMPCHRVVLSSVSTYFRSMFASGMRESKQFRVCFSDVLATTLKAIVDFSYTGHIEITVHNAQDLLSAGSLFQYPDVVDACCDFLAAHISPSNCLGIEQFAAMHQCRELESLANQTALENFSQVALHEEFLQLPGDRVAAYASSDSIDVHSEELVYRAVRTWLDYEPPTTLAGAPPTDGDDDDSTRNISNGGGDSPPGISCREDEDDDSDDGGAATDLSLAKLRRSPASLLNATNGLEDPRASTPSTDVESAMANGNPEYDFIVNGSVCSRVTRDGNTDYVIDMSNGGPVCRQNEVTSVGGVNGKMDGVNGKVDGVNGKVDGVNGKVGGVNSKADGVNGNMGGVNGKVGGVNGKVGGPCSNGIPTVFAECSSDDENDRSSFACTLMSLIRVFTIPVQMRRRISREDCHISRCRRCLALFDADRLPGVGGQISPATGSHSTLTVGRRGSNGSCGGGGSTSQLCVPGGSSPCTANTTSAHTAIPPTIAATTTNVLQEAYGHTAAPYSCARKSTLARRCMVIIGGITASHVEPSTSSACVYSNLDAGFNGDPTSAAIRVTRAVEMYDPRRNKWTQLAAIPSVGGGRGSDATAWFSASAMNDDLLVCGGICDRRGLVSDSWRFRSQQRKWTRTADLLKPRARHASTEWDGRVYVIGGITLDDGNTAAPLQDVECYNPDADQWTLVGTSPHPRTHACLLTYDDNLIEIGGTQKDVKVQSIECYTCSDAGVQCSQEQFMLPQCIQYACVCARQPGVYYILWQDCRHFILLDLLRRTFTRLRPARHVHVHGGLVCLDGLVYAVGGLAATAGPRRRPTSSSERYDPVTDEWEDVASPALQRAAYGCVAIDMT